MAKKRTDNTRKNVQESTQTSIKLPITCIDNLEHVRMAMRKYRVVYNELYKNYNLTDDPSYVSDIKEGC